MSQQNRSRRGQVALSGARISAYAAGSAAALAATGTAEALTVVNVNQHVADTVLGGGAVGIDLQFGSTPYHLALAHGIGTTNAATGYAFTAADAFGSPAVDVAGFTASAYNYVSKLALGAPVAAQAFLAASLYGTMAFNGGYGNDQWLSAGTGYVGVRFNTNQYGWIRVTMDGAPLNSFTVVDYAWGDPGEAVFAGQVPAPGSLPVLALGAVGVSTWRQRRRAA